jgi:NADPH:quinone reductase-like Zn-dependent oxidoreductase
MKRIQYDQYGGPGHMRIADFEPSNPGKGQVLIRVSAAAANPMDWKIRRGDLKFMTGRRFPRGVAHDFAGTVERVGKDINHFKTGAAVFGAVGFKAAGTFA